MLPLNKPLDDVTNVFDRCVNSYNDQPFRLRLSSITSNISVAAQEFESAAQSQKLHLVAATEDVGGVVTKEEMCALYDDKLARKMAPGREFYDRLIMSPQYGLCPLCAQRVVSTLDHHLPKKIFPSLAVTPINLIPACADCNKAKGAYFPKTFAQQTIHPYYDDFSQERWLHAEVIEDCPPALNFGIKPPVSWKAETIERLERHLSVFKLRQLYALHAAQELVSIRKSLVGSAQINGADSVREYLLESGG